MGLALLLIVVREADITEIWREIRNVGWTGMAVVLGIFFLSFWTDTGSWYVTITHLPVSWIWAWRLYGVRMVGEAYNNITPMASIGGEPVKAWLLKTNYQIRFRDAGTSLVLAKTAIVTSLAAYVSIGFVLLINNDKLGSQYHIAAAIGLSALILFSVAFFLMQRLKLSTFVATKLGNSRFGRRLSGLIAIAEDVDGQFRRFYSEHYYRFAGSLAFAFSSWLLGMIELYIVMRLLGYPITWAEAWIIEALVQTVRTGAFFIPSGIGAQEGTFQIVCAAITGNPSVGLAFALIRRGRELVWIAIGLVLAAGYSVRLKDVPMDSLEGDS